MPSFPNTNISQYQNNVHEVLLLDSINSLTLILLAAFISQSPYFNVLAFQLLLHCCSDLYEGTRMAQATDISGIKQILQPLEEKGVLVKRTEEEVCLTSLNIFFISSV